MPVDAFLVIPRNSVPPPMAPITDTPTTDPYFAGTFPGAAVIEVQDFAFAVENPTTIGAASAGAGAGKAKFDELLIHKSVDKSSPALFSMSVTGNHLAAVQLYIRRAGASAGPPGGVAPFAAYEFQMVYITKVEWSGGGGAELNEAVTLVYGAMAIAFQPANPDGTLAQVVKQAWSQITNASNVQDTIPLK